jgi:hypothetical protein
MKIGRIGESTSLARTCLDDESGYLNTEHTITIIGIMVLVAIAIAAAV